MVKDISKQRFGMNEVSSVHPVKEYRVRRGTARLILNLGNKWRLVVNFTLRPLYPRERTSVLTEEEGQ